LLLVFADNISRTWKQIIYFGGRRPAVESTSQDLLVANQPIPRNTSQTPLNQPAKREEASPMSFTPEAETSRELKLNGLQLIRDERGVRIARVENEEAD
jgi:cyanophycin synthetase